MNDVLLKMPQGGAQDPSTIQGERGDQIKRCEEPVDPGQVGENRNDLRIPAIHASPSGETVEESSKADTGQGAGSRHEELDLRALRLAAHFRDAAEDKQRDSAHRQGKATRDQRVKELMNNNR